MLEQDLKDTFANALFPIYKLLVISNCNIKLGEILDVVLKKEASVKNLYAMRNKPVTYKKKIQTSKNDKKNEVNNVDHKKKANNKPKRQFTPWTDIVDNILNVLLKEDLIELPPIVEPTFPNGMPKKLDMKNFATIIGYLDI